MNRHRKIVKLALAVSSLTLSAFVPGSVQAAPITADYSEDYNSYAVGNTAVNNFTESNTAAYTIVNGSGADNQYRAIVSAASGGANASAGVQVTNVGSPTAFSISSDLIIRTVTGVSTSTLNCGLGLFGSVADFTSGNQYRLLYTIFGGNVGKLTLTENATQAGLTGTLTSTGTLAVTTNTKLTLTADLSYSGGSLIIDGRLTDGTNTITISGIDTSPQTGQFFGYRTAVNAVGGSVTETIDYDNFSITVPEPASLAYVGVGGLLLVRRRRKH